jgi:two-component system response regulator RegX3
MPNGSILIAQHNPDLALQLSQTLAGAGYECDHAADGPGTLCKVLTHDYGAVILNMAVEGECEVCATIRRVQAKTAVIFVSEESAPAIKVRAFEAGADDYIVYPFDRQELVLRLHAMLRRIDANSGAQCRIGTSLLDLSSGTYLGNGGPLGLTPKALDLLRYLYHHRGRVVSQAAILRDVWRYASTNTRTIDVHMAMLRRKLEADPSNPKNLITIRGRGYLYVESPGAEDEQLRRRVTFPTVPVDPRKSSAAA